MLFSITGSFIRRPTEYQASKNTRIAGQGLTVAPSPTNNNFVMSITVELPLDNPKTQEVSDKTQPIQDIDTHTLPCLFLKYKAFIETISSTIEK